MRSQMRMGLALLTALVLSTSVVVAQNTAQQKGTPQQNTTAQQKNTGTSGTNTVIDRFTFVAPKAPDSAIDPDRMHVTIHRWSTEEERNRLFQVVNEKGANNVLQEFRSTGAVGYVRWPGGLEYSLRYAYRTPRPDGGADVVLIADRPVWVWWDESAQVPTEPFAYSAIKIRLGAKGTGEGRLATAEQVVGDKAAGIDLRNFEQLTAHITDVRHDRQS